MEENDSGNEKKTRIPVTEPSCCDEIEKRRGWKQAGKPEYTGVKDLE